MAPKKKKTLTEEELEQTIVAGEAALTQPKYKRGHLRKEQAPEVTDSDGPEKPPKKAKSSNKAGQDQENETKKETKAKLPSPECILVLCMICF
jgi:hypothetical protein